MDRNGIIIGILLGFGLGILLGSEFSGSAITMSGASLVFIVLIVMIVLNQKKAND